MHKFILFFFFINLSFTLNGQNVHMQLYWGPLRTNNKTTSLKEVLKGGAFGGQLAIGTNRVQLGIESEDGFSFRPIFRETPDTLFAINNTFLGGFIRANFSSIPAYRLGVVTKLGLGFYTDEVIRSIIEQDDLTIPYPDKILGINGGIGLSGPIKKRFHWDFMYQLNYHQRPELITSDLAIKKHNTWVHAFKFGISMNLIWGKAKREAEAMRN